MDGIIIIDKPKGWTSQDVCSKLKGVLRERRIGHGGTLDPMATGVLPVFCGRATRAAWFSENSVKEYIAAVRPKITTDTEDITGNVISTWDGMVNEADFIAVLPHFTGEQTQLPPMYSAVKIGGKKLYELAREGKTVERTPRTITIYSIEYLGMENGDFIIKVRCSKGTYIRTLANDIGEYMGCGAVLSYLRRTLAGGFTLENAHTIEEVEEHASSSTLSQIMLSVDSLFSSYPETKISGRQLHLCLNGNEFKTGLPDGTYRVYSDFGEFLMVGLCQNGVMKTVKSFFSPGGR